jgi:Uma2 family endonuclease
LIIEILSPATGAKDMKMKFQLYEKHGVREYWLVLPEERSVMIFNLKDGEYGKPEIFTFEDELFSRVLEGLKLDLKELFEDVV